VPSGLVNYLAGVTGIRVRAVLGAVALGALPKTLAYVALGGALAAPFSTRGVLAISLYAAASLAGLVLARRHVRAARAESA
jgi:uncharacterized membrane protein YdjX (TVP38/TMEM64 family)